MIYKVQEGLNRSFPEFKEQKMLIDYYVSFEFPDKQRKMVAWWEAVIIEALKISGQLYLSPAQLQSIFTVHRLKPVPLFNILKHLEKEEKIEWAGRPIEEKGWFGNILGKVWSSNKTEKVEYSSSEKIVVIQYKNQEKAKLKFLIESELREETVIDYDYLRTSIFKQVSLSDESIEQMLTELKEEKWLGYDSIDGKQVLLHSKNKGQISNDKWKDIEKSKFTLRSRIQFFQNQIEKKSKLSQNERKNAKQCLNQNNKLKAKYYLQNMKSLQKINEQYITRKKLLSETLHQLEMQEINSITFDEMTKCHEVIQKMKIDPSKLQEIQEKHEEINEENKYKNDKFKEMVGEEDNSQVDQLMAQLQMQINKGKISPKKNKVEIPSNPFFQKQEKGNMDIQ